MLGGEFAYGYRNVAVAHRIFLSFFASRDPEITAKHCLEAFDQFNTNDQEMSTGLHYAKNLWADTCNDAGAVQIPNDAYLKQYAIALSKGNIRLSYDLVIFDEAQDANDAVVINVESETMLFDLFEPDC